MSEGPIEAFLDQLQALDVQVTTDGHRLHCTAPAGVLTPALRQQIADRKPELLALLTPAGQPRVQPVIPPVIAPVARGGALPLSFAQQRLWFLHQLMPDNPFYNVPAAIRLRGSLNRAALERSFNAIVQRHEALRTCFTELDGQPLQVIAEAVELPLPVVDLRAIPTEQQAVTAQRLATEEAQRPFDLRRDRLLRVTLLQLRDDEQILLLTLHHIVADGWSLGVLVRELGHFYRALVQERPAELPDLPIQYADFAHWQRQWLQGEVLEAQLTYWREQLRQLPALELPGDRPRPIQQTYRGATHPLHLSAALTQALEAFSQQQGVSLFMTLLAAFQTLLYRYTGQDDIAIGSPIANRHRSELEGLIGFFVNSLVLRTNLAGNPAFRELLARVRQTALEAYAHQDLPFEKLVEDLGPERNLSRNPLFQIGFALQNAPMQPLELPGLTLEPIQVDPGTTRFDLEVHLWPPAHGLSSLWQSQAEGLSGFVAYSRELFDRDRIQRLIDHYQTLLAAIVAHPDTPIADLPLLTASERQQLLVDWNQTQVDYQPGRAFHHWFEDWAEQTPEAIALVCGPDSLTYRQLNQRANQLAHTLRRLELPPNSRVGLCVERSPDLLIGLLGILKAGAAYLPLDPAYPSDRLRLMLSDAQVPLLLTQSGLVDHLPETPAQLLCLDRHIPEHESQSNPQVALAPDDCAYVIYTSGSTGTPKGVLLSQRGLSNVITAQQQVFDLSPASRILQFSSLSFDASVFEIVMALANGGTLVIPPAGARLGGMALAQWLRDQAITHMILPPAVLALLPSADLPALQAVIAGGEACSQQIVDRWAADRRFFNAYGPTEATIWATVAELHPGDAVTIGRPVANTQVYILDSQQQPVPIGIPGELYIGGEGLSQGYLNRPELTAERFLCTPVADRLYRTGDRARYRADGQIEFLGRLDQQIKRRGYRIELAEIEAVLRQHPAVNAAVATILPGDDRLFAYVNLNLQHPAIERRTLQAQQINDWQTLYNQTYQQPAPGDPTCNLTGWNSSYTNQPIPIEQMQEWIDDRVQQLLALKPRRVLEIGCGTGLLLFRIAPHCQEYWGTDFSAVSLAAIQPQLQGLSQVKLLQRLATDFSEIQPGTFDLVILNSVVQYFPDLDYLMQVLQGAIQAVAPGGVLFVGDVRSLPLLPAFHAAVQLEQADRGLEPSQLRQRVEQALFEEPELAIDPAFFAALPARFPALDRVQVRLSRGQFCNEMTQFRYSVLGWVKPAAERSPVPAPPIQWFDWTRDHLSLPQLRQYLVEAQPDRLGITCIPNQRVIAAVKAADLIFADAANSGALKTVGRIQDAFANAELPAIDPQMLWNLETELPYKVELCWSVNTATGDYDAILMRQGAETKIEMPLTQQWNRSRSWESYTNQPLQTQIVRQLLPELRRHLEQKLPDYMQPAALVPLARLPLTANGKLDRQALPIPEALPAASPAAAPRSATEATLVQIWTELLRLKRVSIHDNFFELGGHSLLATQLASRLRESFGVDVPLRSLFEAPTIAQLAPVIDALRSAPRDSQEPELVRLDRNAHRRSRSSLASDRGGRQEG